MKDVRIVSLDRVVARRRKLDKTLNASLSALSDQQGTLVEALSIKRIAAAEQGKVLSTQAEKIDAMMSGATGAFCADDFLRQREFQATLNEQQAAMLAQVKSAAQALAEKESELAEIKTRMVINRARISIYQDRRDGICAAIAFAAEEAQDEEANEARRPVR